MRSDIKIVSPMWSDLTAFLLNKSVRFSHFPTNSEKNARIKATQSTEHVTECPAI